jgi:hypothetical protein
MPVAHRALDWRPVSVLLALLGAASASAQSAPTGPLLEVHAWGGYSGFSASPQSPTSNKSGGTGLRLAEVAVWPTTSLRLFGRYDNSLSLDNLTLLRAGTRVPTWSGGGLINWNEHFTTVVYGGRRTLPGRIRETIAGVEQVAYLHNGAALKAGADVGRRQDKITEWVGHVAVNAPLGDRIRVEPVIFYSRSGLPGESQWRALLSAEQQLGRGSSLGLGVASGRISGTQGGFDGTVWDSYARVSAGIGGLNRAQLMVRHERAPSVGPLTSVSLGLSLVVRRP